MDTMLGFAGLVITTLVALFAALALEAALLRAMIALMKPATADRRSAKAQIAQGARLVAEAYGKVR
jgi:hypothetical protein